MKKELLVPKVENVAIALTQNTLSDGEKEYSIYLLNLRDDIMEGIIITCTGFGENPSTGEKIKTSTIRHSMEILLPNEAAKIEPILPELFAISNEYWVSFWVNDVLYDKQFVFPAHSIREESMEMIEIIGLKGILIR